MSDHKSGYYWTNGDGVLARCEMGGGIVDPFFETEESAENYLEERAQVEDSEKYEGMVLRKSDGDKIKEATEVLTNQAGFGQFTKGGAD
jgi:hypothetical protein